MPRLHIFGASGSGTTTLGRELAVAIDGLHLDTDDFYWLPTDPPFTTKRAPQERVVLIKQAASESTNWVLSGSICSWGDPLLADFTTAVFVRLDPQVRMARLAAREALRGGKRILPGGDMHAAHTEFMAWAESYDTADATQRSLQLHEAWLTRLACPVVRVNSADSTQQLVGQVLAAMN